MTDHKTSPSQKADQKLSFLIKMYYTQLKERSTNRMRWERANHSWTGTVLVHELFLRLEGVDVPSEEDEFMRFAVHKFEQILVDHARKRGAKKRRYDLRQELLSEPMVNWDHTVWIMYSEILEKLAELNPRRAEIFQMRRYGFENNEVAKILKLSPQTTSSQYRLALVWLKNELDLNSEE